MKSVSILCTDPAHPVNARLVEWAAARGNDVSAQIFRSSKELVGGDLLLLVSCHEIIRAPTRSLFRHTLVLHASALPEGRGMSPHVWQILRGQTRLLVTLLEAEDELDSGDIWHQIEVVLDGTELHDEINAKLFDAETDLMTWALAHSDHVVPRKQVGSPTFFRRRTPADSEIDPTKPLVDCFDQLRVADPDRYPAYFRHRGCTYRIRIEKA
jgi:methionyl-tRNA formyltransferase